MLSRLANALDQRFFLAAIVLAIAPASEHRTHERIYECEQQWHTCESNRGNPQPDADRGDTWTITEGPDDEPAQPNEGHEREQYSERRHGADDGSMADAERAVAMMSESKPYTKI